MQNFCVIPDRKNMQLPLTQISHWAFIGGVILAIGAGLIAIPYITTILFILGLEN